jgi:hypothetical protein
LNHFSFPPGARTKWILPIGFDIEFWLETDQLTTSRTGIIATTVSHNSWGGVDCRVIQAESTDCRKCDCQNSLAKPSVYTHNLIPSVAARAAKLGAATTRVLGVVQLEFVARAALIKENVFQVSPRFFASSDARGEV